MFYDLMVILLSFSQVSANIEFILFLPNNVNLITKTINPMKNILIIGSVGQIGSELTMRLREIYGANNVVAGFRKTSLSSPYPHILRKELFT